MTPTQMQEFNDAVALAQSGQKASAYTRLKVLSAATTGATDNVNLLLWVAFTTPDLSEAEHAISRAETIDPSSQSVVGAKDWLRQQQIRPVPTPTPTPTLTFTQPPPLPQPQFQPQIVYYQPMPQPTFSQRYGHRWPYLAVLLFALVMAGGVMLPWLNIETPVSPNSSRVYQASVNGLGQVSSPNQFLQSELDSSNINSRNRSIKDGVIFLGIAGFAALLAFVGLTSGSYRNRVGLGLLIGLVGFSVLAIGLLSEYKDIRAKMDTLNSASDGTVATVGLGLYAVIVAGAAIAFFALPILFSTPKPSSK